MEELPKIARYRLAHPAKQDAASAPDTLRGAAHPDANLLSAFVERALSEDERAAVLGHLADCGECRELVSLAFPAPDVQAALGGIPRPAKTGVVRWTAWLGWRTLRWGVLAASVGVVMVGAFRTGLLRWPRAQRTTVAENRPVSSVEAPNGAVSQPTQAPQALQAPPAAAGPAERAERSQLSQEMDALKPAEQSGTTARYRAESSMLLKQKAPAPASGAAWHAEEADKVGASEVAKAAPAKDARALAVKGAPSASPNASQPSTTNRAGAPANAPGAVGGALKTAPSRRDLDNKSLAITQEVEVRATPAAREKKSDELAAENTRVSPQGQAMAPPPPPPVASQRSERRPASGLIPQSATQEVAGARKQVQRAAVPKAASLERGVLRAYWSISASGRLEHSLAADGPWDELHVDDSVKFRVVTAEDSDVWAGGSGGALYHSTDAGEHWRRLKVGPNQNARQEPVTDAIVSIRFTDREHGTVTTDALETWVTADGGEHWSVGTRPAQ